MWSKGVDTIRVNRITTNKVIKHSLALGHCGCFIWLEATWLRRRTDFGCSFM